MSEHKETRAIGSTILSTKLKEIWKICLYAILGPLLLYTLIILLSLYREKLANISKSSSTNESTLQNDKRPIFWIHAKSRDEGYLRHVFNVLERLGFQRGNNESDWDLLWAHDYPFGSLSVQLKKLHSHQRVNHFPGCGYITNKVDLSTTMGKYIPKSFKLPDSKNDLLAYVAKNPGKTFVQKSNGHRGIRIKPIDELNLDIDEDSFVQEFIDRPYLVDGYKFDIGIYTVITSIDPLRIYAYKGDVLFRFCPTMYYPFDSENLDKYVVGDDYLPIWKIPSLMDYYVKLGFSMKDSFDAYLLSKGQDPVKMWNNAYEAIKDVALKKESRIKEIIGRFGNGRHFFELVRFDFTIDEDLNVFVMEANMSPNLSSAHYPPNRLLYEQVLFNMFALVGIAQRSNEEFRRSRNWQDREVEVADKNLVVLPELCRSCDDCFRFECQLCKPCFTDETRLILSQSYLEHQNKMDYKRIFPPSVITKNMILKDYTMRNQLLVRWYQGKCEIDSTWCS